MNFFRFVLVLWLFAASAAAFAQEPFRDGASAMPADEDETRLWDESREIAEEYARTRKLSPDEEMNRYVQGVLDRLFPDFRGTMRARILLMPEVNAFAMPDGSIYIYQGLLARMENEAQLAALLAHEGTHFVNRHGVQMRTAERSLAGASVVVQAALDLVPIGVGPVSGAITGSVSSAMASMASTAATQALARTAQKTLVAGVLRFSAFGYSRALEQEADDQGFARLKAAGYDVTEAHRIFEILAREMEARKIAEPFFFSTHPQLKARAENFMELAQGAAGGERGEAGFNERMAALRLASLKDELNTGRFNSIIAHLTQPGTLQRYPVQARFFLGEAYRLRAEEGDMKLAEDAYLSALEVFPEDYAACRALGILKLKTGVPAEAEVLFLKSMALAPDAEEREFVEQYLEQVRRALPQKGV